MIKVALARFWFYYTCPQKTRMVAQCVKTELKLSTPVFKASLPRSGPLSPAAALLGSLHHSAPTLCPVKWSFLNILYHFPPLNSYLESFLFFFSLFPSPPREIQSGVQVRHQCCLLHGTFPKISSIFPRTGKCWLYITTGQDFHFHFIARFPLWLVHYLTYNRWFNNIQMNPCKHAFIYVLPIITGIFIITKLIQI